MRFIILYFFLISIFSCNDVSFFKKEKSTAIDTVVDFSSVDSCPSFNNCVDLIEKEEKAFCFRETIYMKIGRELDKTKLESNDSIHEKITMQLRVNSKGTFSIDTIIYSKKIKLIFPELDSLLHQSILALPKVFPATKRGIPVTTVYKLPIEIK